MFRSPKLSRIVPIVTEYYVKDKARDDIVPLEPIIWNEAFIASLTLHMFLLQFENAIQKLF